LEDKLKVEASTAKKDAEKAKKLEEKK